MILCVQKLHTELKRPLACFPCQSQRTGWRKSPDMIFRRFTLVFLLLILLFGARNSMARIQSGLVTGTVVDAQTGELLPGATVQIEGTYVGTISNEVGLYSIVIPEFPVRLKVRYIGYQSSTKEFSGPPDGRVIFSLEPSRLELPELIVTGENPAYNIMRRVIEEKKRWSASFDTYRVNAYNRFRMENDTGIVSIWESSTIAFWDKERGIREISLAQKQTANTEIDELLPAALFMKNFYDDDIEVAGHVLMGVTHKNALDYYHFELTGTRAIDDQLVYDISVRPKSKLGSGFVGSIAVLDEVYALLAIELEPGEAFLFPLPIKNLTIHYRQQFSRFGSDVWLPVDLRSSIALDISFQGLLSFPTIHIEQFTRLSNFELNVELPDSLYESDDIITADSTFIASVSVAALEDLAIPLTPEETLAYITIDSTMTLEKAFKPRGILARFVDTENDSDREGRRNGRRSRGSDGNGSPSFLDLYEVGVSPDIWFNQVEGWHLGGAGTLDIDRKVLLTGRVGYETARKDWTFGGQMRIGNRRWIEVGYLDHVPRRYLSEVTGRLLNSIDVLLLQPDYFDYVHEKKFYFTFSSRVKGLRGLRFSATLATADYSDVERNISDTFFGTPSHVIENAQIDTGTLQSVSVKFEFKDPDSIPFGIGGQYTAELNVEQSLGGSIVDDGHFTRVDASVVWRVPTFYSRRLLPNSLELKLTGGTVSGRLPRQRFGVVDGSTLLTPFGGLRTRKDRPYEGESFAAVLVEHSFRTILFERLGLRTLVRYGWNVIVTGAVAKTRIEDGRLAPDESEPGTPPGQVHSEVGLSLSGIFGLARLDYSYRL
ncbi:MAG: carboxypeptidase-like regulatory domain-containing protein, partial [Bacteroidetes bacterium]